MTENHTTDDTESVDGWVQAAAIDRQAFGQLFDRFYPSIFAYCSRRMLVRAMAEDVASEVFLKVANGIRTFRGTTAEDFRRWIFRIATNEINAQLRQSGRRRELLEAAARMGVIRAESTKATLGCERDLNWEQVYQAIEALNSREQTIISLRFFAQLKYEQIAAVLEMSPGAVRVAMNRTLNKLRDRLREPIIAPCTGPRERGELS